MKKFARIGTIPWTASIFAITFFIASQFGCRDRAASEQPVHLVESINLGKATTLAVYWDDYMKFGDAFAKGDIIDQKRFGLENMMKTEAWISPKLTENCDEVLVLSDEQPDALYSIVFISQGQVLDAFRVSRIRGQISVQFRKDLHKNAKEIAAGAIICRVLAETKK